jgi:hypothetical protein
MQEKTIQEEAGLPDNWEIVDQAPIVPGQPLGVPASPQGPSPYYIGSISPTLQHDAAFFKTGYQTPGVAVSPLMPLSLGGFASNNAAVQSVSQAQSGSSTTPVTPVTPTYVQLFEVNGQNLGVMAYINGLAV